MELSRREDIMPTDFTNPCLQGDFLDWTVRDLTHSWGEGEQPWFNMYVGLYLYEPWHWSTCHPRCFAARPVSRDRLLPERFCSWSCSFDNGQKDILKSTWPTMEALTKHWYRSRCSDQMWAWELVVDELSLTCAELVQKIFGASLKRWPLPSWPEAIKILPKSLPDKHWSEHSDRIYAWLTLVFGARLYPQLCPQYHQEDHLATSAGNRSLEPSPLDPPPPTRNLPKTASFLFGGQPHPEQPFSIPTSLEPRHQQPIQNNLFLSSPYCGEGSRLHSDTVVLVTS